jgi:hypothetical protein
MRTATTQSTGIEKKGVVSLSHKNKKTKTNGDFFSGKSFRRRHCPPTPPPRGTQSRVSQTTFGIPCGVCVCVCVCAREAPGLPHGRVWVFNSFLAALLENLWGGVGWGPTRTGVAVARSVSQGVRVRCQVSGERERDGARNREIETRCARHVVFFSCAR